MIRRIIRPFSPGKNLLIELLLLTALMLLSSCAAQIVGRAQQAINATVNTADAVVAACGASNTEAQIDAGYCLSSAGALQAASDAYQQAADDATAATNRRVSAQQAVTNLQNGITSGVVKNPYDINVRLPELAAAAKLAAQQESAAIAARDQAKGPLQAALDWAKEQTMIADALTQKCGGTPITVRLPGYSETYWDISS